MCRVKVGAKLSSLFGGLPLGLRNVGKLVTLKDVVEGKVGARCVVVAVVQQTGQVTSVRPANPMASRQLALVDPTVDAALQMTILGDGAVVERAQGAVVYAVIKVSHMSPAGTAV